MQSDVGAHLVCALHLVAESNAGAHEVRPYGKPYARESHSTASLRLRMQVGARPLWGGGVGGPVGDDQGPGGLHSALSAQSGEIGDRGVQGELRRAVVTRVLCTGNVKPSARQPAHRQRAQAAAAMFQNPLSDPERRKKFEPVNKEKGGPLAAVVCARGPDGAVFRERR